jgi:hypothetical protein
MTLDYKDVQDALYLNNGEKLVVFWKGDHECEEYNSFEIGILVLTNKRLIFLEERGGGFFSKSSYHIKFQIPLYKITAISMGGGGLFSSKYVSISSYNNPENIFHLDGIDNEDDLELMFRRKIDRYKSEKRADFEDEPQVEPQPIPVQPIFQRTEPKQLDTSFEKGFAFEDYLITLFDKYPFRLFSRTKDKPFKTVVHTEADNLPDLTFRNLETNQKLFIEAKWRANLIDGSLYIAELHSLERYKEYSKIENAPCYVVVGLGGYPRNPNRMFLIPLYEISGTSLTPPVFQRFERSPTKIFSWDEFKRV